MKAPTRDQGRKLQVGYGLQFAGHAAIDGRTKQLTALDLRRQAAACGIRSMGYAGCTGSWQPLLDARPPELLECSLAEARPRSGSGPRRAPTGAGMSAGANEGGGGRRPSRWHMTDDVLQRLATTIHARRGESAAKSYTRQLLDSGPERCAKKLGEEATETVIAAVGPDPVALRREAADLLYHLLVVLECRGVAWDDVLAELGSRMGTSGLEEKAARASGPGPSAG